MTASTKLAMRNLLPSAKMIFVSSTDRTCKRMKGCSGHLPTPHQLGSIWYRRLWSRFWWCVHLQRILRKNWKYLNKYTVNCEFNSTPIFFLNLKTVTIYRTQTSDFYRQIPGDKFDNVINFYFSLICICILCFVWFSLMLFSHTFLQSIFYDRVQYCHSLSFWARRF